MCVSLGFLARGKLPRPVDDIPGHVGLDKTKGKEAHRQLHGLLRYLDGLRKGDGQKLVGGRGTRGRKVLVETSPRRD